MTRRDTLRWLLAVLAAGLRAKKKPPTDGWTTVELHDGALDVVVVSLLVPR